MTLAAGLLLVLSLGFVIAALVLVGRANDILVEARRRVEIAEHFHEATKRNLDDQHAVDAEWFV